MIEITLQLPSPSSSSCLGNHASGKFGQGGYKTSGGLHGVGACIKNLNRKDDVNVRLQKQDVLQVNIDKNMSDFEDKNFF